MIVVVVVVDTIGNASDTYRGFCCEDIVSQLSQFVTLKSCNLYNIDLVGS